MSSKEVKVLYNVQNMSKVNVHFMTSFVFEKQHLVVSGDCSRDKAYEAIWCETKQVPDAGQGCFAAERKL